MPEQPPDPFEGIKSRIGDCRHVRLTIHPLRYQADRLGGRAADLQELVSRCAVRIRGWDLPYVERRGARSVGHTIYSETQYSTYDEAWRFHRSGLFQQMAICREHDDGYQSKLREHWGTMAGAIFYLDWVNVIYSFCEYFEFARRLAIAAPFEEGVLLKIEYCNMSGVGLSTADFRINTGPFRHLQFEAEPIKRELAQVRLASYSVQEARQALLEFFDNFSWGISEAAVEHYQTQFYSLRIGDDPIRPPEVADGGPLPTGAA